MNILPPTTILAVADATNLRGCASILLRLRRSNPGILALLISFPFMYYPKILEGDTQLWVFAGAIFSLFTFRTSRFVLRSDSPMLLLAALCILAYAMRSELGPDLLRACYTQVAFVVFWMVCRREQGDFFPSAVRLTILIWLAVGLYQYISIAQGLPIEIAGRFVEGRSGVPSLTPEPSFYGSLSILHMMYLLSEGKKKNNPYIVCAAASVVLSGSLFALVLLVFPLMKLRMQPRIPIFIVILLMGIAYTLFITGSISSRISIFSTTESGFAGLLLDPSLNLRIGHLYFTLYKNRFDSLLLISPSSFMSQYNSFARDSGVFIETGSNFILPAAGELIYGSGIVGALLLVLFILKARDQCTTPAKKFEKVAFIAACMLNPISLSNVFLVMYAQQKD
ncbi:MAG: hypothetical protein ND866_01930 [Pyrinomonadaceae bacterium]|nr:hypothetical protein [Pyrinomonadaceae bacterium]